MTERNYGFSLRKAEIFDRKNRRQDPFSIVYALTKLYDPNLEKTLELIEEDLFKNRR